jgi:hypothetical protein
VPLVDAKRLEQQARDRTGLIPLPLQRKAAQQTTSDNVRDIRGGAFSPPSLNCRTFFFSYQAHEKGPRVLPAHPGP